jgi:cytidine deaminase
MTTGQQGPELVFGLVGAIGTDLSRVSKILSDALAKYSYQTEYCIQSNLIENEIRLSQLLHALKDHKDLPLPHSVPMDEYYEKHMTAGDKFRGDFGTGDAIAILSIAKLREIRKSKSTDPNRPAQRFAYILRSLKHPEEVSKLRSVYGSGFVLFAVFTPREERVEHLAQEIAASHHSFDTNKFKQNAERLIDRDEAEVTDKFGQNVRDTFPLGDLFLDATVADKLKLSVDRFLEIFFGYPFHTPTRDEYGIFHAYAAALRSADLSRQVGAVISTEEGDVIAVGTNEVPKAGGGLYWEGDREDHRDFAEGPTDQSSDMKRVVIAETLERLQANKWFSDQKKAMTVEQLTSEATKEGGIMTESQLVNNVSFDRVVHAEMAALTDSARRTVTVKDCILYTTTLPCHNCAKHIVASGIKRVVYIQPYPKSLAFRLHRDSISMGAKSDGRTAFEPFVGVAPRNYFELFMMNKRKDGSGRIIAWNAQISQPRLFGTPPLSYIATEESSITALEKYY